MTICGILVTLGTQNFSSLILFRISIFWFIEDRSVLNVQSMFFTGKRTVAGRSIRFADSLIPVY